MSDGLPATEDSARGLVEGEWHGLEHLFLLVIREARLGVLLERIQHGFGGSVDLVADGGDATFGLEEDDLRGSANEFFIATDLTSDTVVRYCEIGVRYSV